MTTIIKVVGANFTNINMPSIAPIDTTLFVLDGLLGAYRPNTTNGITDLSGNNNDLITVGTPILSAEGFIGDRSNGYSTPLLETVSFTQIAVYKIPANTYNVGAFIIGSYQALPVEGSGLYSYGLSGSTHNLTAQLRVKNTGGGQISLDKSLGLLPERYLFVAFTVDAITNRAIVSCPTLGTTYEFAISTSSLANRNISTTFKVKLVANANKADWLSKVHFAEGLIYDKALSAAQIQLQYQKSQAYMQSVGIEI